MPTKRLFDLTNKVALVTGGSTGIGYEIADGLCSMGARVVIVARKEERLQRAVKELSSKGYDVEAIRADVSQTEEIAPLVDALIEKHGTLDVLVNNAGTNWIAPAQDYPDAGWTKVMSVCIDGPFRLTREIGKRIMIPGRKGRIINIGSTAGLGGNGTGQTGGGHFIGYHAAKGALHSFTRGLAVEWGPLNIAVNTLCPGFIETKAAAAFQTSVRESAIGQIPLGRFGSGEDIKGVAAFLASDAACYITGQTIVVDGGISAN
ncbi:gluconate 5-dehydrogenase protein (plasmid) [Rhizobium gallicum]|uniref:Gluconate 5-dehydrogenase protein n=1 Tax=Rhizobium gallicum TaxID=56730 RepID=A0A1L5NS08_9HYPH|nr:glucose 1-dehydrogenase [Rhizobium gallicum]APO70681.1 gluconate 5-dehydrogenase protein [Rhizobium gallicum]